jgi:hypothetical protein
MVEAAVERGVNYLWWGALRTKKMARGIKVVARKGREDLVVVVHALSRKPSTMSKLVEKSLNRLAWITWTYCSWQGTTRRPIRG